MTEVEAASMSRAATLARQSEDENAIAPAPAASAESESDDADSQEFAQQAAESAKDLRSSGEVSTWTDFS